MKLAKLSLAAIVTAGAMTTFANATPLEEAIKGVDLSGMVRYRFTSDQKKYSSTDNHAFKVVTNFVIPVTENLKTGVMLIGANDDNAKDGSAFDAGSGTSLNIERAWFQYVVDGFSLKAGKLEIFSPWTDPGTSGSVGDGALALFNITPEWTFGAGAFFATNLSVGFGSNGIASLVASLPTTTPEETASKAVLTALNNGVDVGQENLYALGILGPVGPVSLQLWAASMTNVFDYSVFADATFEMAGFSFEAQVNNLKLANETKGLFGDDSGIYWGVKAGYEMAGFGVEAGYTQNDEDQPIYTLANDDSHDFIFSGGKQINGDIANTPDMKAMFIDLSYSVDKFGFGAGYAHGETGDVDLDEFYVSAAYKYAKNFKLSTYFSSYEMDNDIYENDKIRFEAKYSF